MCEQKLSQFMSHTSKDRRANEGFNMKNLKLILSQFFKELLIAMKAFTGTFRVVWLLIDISKLTTTYVSISS